MMRLPIFALFLFLSGCERVRPWQRGMLAHPSMSLEDPRGPAEAHVHAIQEGATGGEGGSGAGCGCN